MDISLIERLAGASILVVGDVLLDRFIEGRVTRISREAPVPVLKYTAGRGLMGGACNVAANVMAFGGSATLVGLIGDDADGRELGAQCAGYPRLTKHLIVDPKRHTNVKTRYLSGWQQLLCIDSPDSGLPGPEIEAQLIATARAALSRVAAVVISDYGRGALSDAAVRTVIAAARQAGKPVIVDPRRADAAVFSGATVVTPNTGEMEAFSGIRVKSDAEAIAACRKVLDGAAIDAILLTRGADGMTLVEREGAVIHVPAVAQSVFDVTGAGDTVVAALAAALAVGARLADAVRLANIAAGVVVAKPGTATADPHELLQAVGVEAAAGVAGREDAAEQARVWREQNLRVGFTNGVFDLLHQGHIHSLERAKRRVDRLVVGINSDASVRRLKGPGRPVQDEAARAAVVAALRFVDLVVIFDEDTPEELIRAIRPNRLFKGADYTEQTVVGAEFVRASGGEVELLPLLPGFSTTSTVAKVRGQT